MSHEDATFPVKGVKGDSDKAEDHKNMGNPTFYTSIYFP